MAPSGTTESTKLIETRIVALSVLTLIAGAGGMAVSFLFLASQNHLDVIAGAVGFLAGVVLFAAGLLSLSIQRRSPLASQSAVRVTRCLMGLLPPLVATLAWPVLYFGAFIAGLVLMPVVLLDCVVWAWVLSRNVSVELSALFDWSRVRIVRGFVFFLQVIGILASWSLFIELLDQLGAMGFKVGWS